jgi:hypothetical protein
MLYLLYTILAKSYVTKIMKNYWDNKNPKNFPRPPLSYPKEKGTFWFISLVTLCRVEHCRSLFALDNWWCLEILGLDKARWGCLETFCTPKCSCNKWSDSKLVLLVDIQCGFNWRSYVQMVGFIHNLGMCWIQPSCCNLTYSCLFFTK